MFAFPVPLLRLAFLFLCLASTSPAAVRVGLISEPKLQVIEELCLAGLQADPALEFLERSQLSLLTEELSLGQVLDRAGWTACDALVLLNTFSGQDHATSSLVVRIVSTRDLKILGLWVYPFLAKDPGQIAERLVARLGPALSRASAETPRSVVSLALLRADEPRLTRLAEPATYQLAAALSAHPELALVERWNVRDPAFEQWLRQTQPTDVRPPDLLINGALADYGGHPGLRLDLNGASTDFPSSSAELAPALVAAARAIAGAPRSTPPPAAHEIRRHEDDARWFWKWSAFTHAAAAAETALFLGSQNPETAYIRALANLRPPSGYTSNLPYTDTPDADTLSRALHGADCFLRIPAPPASLPFGQRLPHLRYAEQSVLWLGQLLEGLYFSREILPGTPGERAQLRELAARISERAWAFYRAFDYRPNSYAPVLERIDAYGINLTLPLALLDYAAFLEPDADRLAALYAECLEELARRQSDNDELVLTLARSRHHHRAWFVSWDAATPSPENRARAQAVLLAHPKPEVRTLAGLLPLLCRPDDERHRRLAAAWLADLAQRWSADLDFFLKPGPPSLPRSLLSTSGLVLTEYQPLLGDALPAADWHRFYSMLLEKAPPRLSEPENISLLNLIRRLEAETAKRLPPAPEPVARAISPPTRAATPALTAQNRARTYALLLEARPTDSDAARRAASEEIDARSVVWREEVAAAGAARPAPRLTFTSDPRPLERVPAPEGGLADRLAFAGPLGDFVSATQDEDGALWLLFCIHGGPDNTTLVWRQLDPAATSLLREIRLEHTSAYFFNAHHRAFVVRSGRIATATPSGLHLIDLTSQTARTIETTGIQNPQLWRTTNSLWLSGSPGLIYQIEPATGVLTLVSSAMRTPARNRLDARAAYEVTAVFEHDSRLHVWTDGILLHEWDAAARDWRERYSTHAHWRAGQRYPLDLILAAIGPGLSAGKSQESFFRLLRLDSALSGRFAPAFSSADVVSGEPMVWPSAARLGDRVWTLHRDRAGTSLLSRQIATGRGERRPLGKGDFDGLHAFDTGILFADTRAHTLHHIPRQRLDPANAPAAPSAAAPSTR